MKSTTPFAFVCSPLVCSVRPKVGPMRRGAKSYSRLREQPQMSRQIIKTRSQRPYIIARIVIAAIALIIVLIAIAYSVAERRARTHHVSGDAVHIPLRQDSAFARRNWRPPAITTHEGAI